MMDRGNPDYSLSHGGWFDNFIDTHDVLIIQAAGNQPWTRPYKSEYALTWGSDSYNAIVVGRSTPASGNESVLMMTMNPVLMMTIPC